VVHPFGVLSDEQRDFATANGLETWAYTPLLSGAYDDEAKPIPDVYDHPGTARRLAALTRIASAHDAQRGQIVLAWLLAHGIRPILGGSKIAQLDLAMDAAGIELAPEQIEELDAAV
jgi:aryl-alcohol dehydrogenase-like predicted oxidoreductase